MKKLSLEDIPFVKREDDFQLRSWCVSLSSGKSTEEAIEEIVKSHIEALKASVVNTMLTKGKDGTLDDIEGSVAYLSSDKGIDTSKFKETIDARLVVAFHNDGRLRCEQRWDFDKVFLVKDNALQISHRPYAKGVSSDERSEFLEKNIGEYIGNYNEFVDVYWFGESSVIGLSMAEAEITDYSKVRLDNISNYKL